jgi:hypothetical protein
MSNTALVFITSRSLSMYQPGHVSYHWPAHWGRTWCGIPVTQERGVMVRRDTADLIADQCQHCYPEGRPL